MLAVLIAQIYCVALVCITAIKWHNPDTESSFIATIGALATGAAGFMVLHFNQKNIESKVDRQAVTTAAAASTMISTAKTLATTVVNTAQDLKTVNAQVTKAQTEELVNAMGEKTAEIVQEVKTPNGAQ